MKIVIDDEKRVAAGQCVNATADLFDQRGPHIDGPEHARWRE